LISHGRKKLPDKIFALQSGENGSCSSVCMFVCYNYILRAAGAQKAEAINCARCSTYCCSLMQAARRTRNICIGPIVISSWEQPKGMLSLGVGRAMGERA